ncbi:hypothetical protein BaRGS_00015937, partial [Batillaria attramentaria]
MLRSLAIAAFIASVKPSCDQGNNQSTVSAEAGWNRTTSVIGCPGSYSCRADISQNCIQWAELGDCTSNMSYMPPTRWNCPRACNSCVFYQEKANTRRLNLAACNLPRDIQQTNRHHVDDGDILEALFVLEPATVQHYFCQFRLTTRYHHQLAMDVQRFDVNNGSEPCVKLDIAELEYQENNYTEDVNVLDDKVVCGKRYYPPMVFNSTTGLKLTASGDPKAIGFIMQYSVHNVSHAPVRLDNGLWNCSGEHYPSFEHHVRCNMNTECGNAIDETNCPYTSHTLGTAMNYAQEGLTLRSPGVRILDESGCTQDGTVKPNYHWFEYGDVLEISIDLHPGTSHGIYCEARPKMKFDKSMSLIVEKYHISHEDGECIQSLLVDLLYMRDEAVFAHTPCQQPTAIDVGSQPVGFSLEESAVKVILSVNEHDVKIERRMYISVRLRLYVLEERGRGILNHIELSPQSGYITNYLFDGKTLYFRDIRIRFVIFIYSHELVISFRHFDIPCVDGSVDILRGKVGNKDSRQSSSASGFQQVTYFPDDIDFVHSDMLCGTLYVPPFTYNTTTGVSLITSGPGTGTGFKLLYSIHKVSKAPQMLGNGMWNCSVKHYTSYAEHVKCNLVTECHGGEDEKACPYTSPACGSGLIDVGGKCYKYFNVQDRLSWYEAQTRCLDLNMRLVNPKTPQEWERIQDVLSYGMTSSTFYTGLRTSQGDPAYKEIWQWSDHTMAYYHHVHANGHVVKPTCSKFRYTDNDKLLAVGCSSLETDISGLMCESVKLSATPPQTPRFHLQNGNISSIFFSEKTLVQCPDGHVVKDFLSCDLESKCGVQSYATSCRTTEVGDIPMFTCSVGSQTVHYTLVCDHRRDCADG